MLFTGLFLPERQNLLKMLLLGLSLRTCERFDASAVNLTSHHCFYVLLLYGFLTVLVLSTFCLNSVGWRENSWSNSSKQCYFYIYPTPEERGSGCCMRTSLQSAEGREKCRGSDLFVSGIKLQFSTYLILGCILLVLIILQF